jgi:hypothetical protein
MRNGARVVKKVRRWKEERSEMNCIPSRVRNGKKTSMEKRWAEKGMSVQQKKYAARPYFLRLDHLLLLK